MPHIDRKDIKPYDARISPLAAPEVGIFDSPTVNLCINREWASHIYGQVTRLTRPDAWAGEFDEQYLAVQEVMKFLISFQEGMYCMTDFCCPEDSEKFQQMIDNQVTMINNQLTFIINQNTQNTLIDTTLYQTVINNIQDNITQNYNMTILNKQLYDGTPQSIAPNLDSDFSGGTNSEDALCQALKRYLEWQCAIAGQQAAAIAATSGAALAALIALAPLTLGLSVVAGLAAAAVGFGWTAMAAALNDPVAMRKILCCMFDSMKGQAITEENFQNIGTCFDDHDFYSHEYIIASQISNSALYYPENYLGFIRMLGEAQGNGSKADCDCCSEVESYMIVGLNGTSVTKLNDYQYELVQTSFTLSELYDPFCGGVQRHIFTLEFQESQERYIDIIANTAPQDGYKQVNFEGEIVQGVGGGGGVGKWFQWFIADCPEESTEYRTTITIACPSNLGINP
jgi:hypothetical protein